MQFCHYLYYDNSMSALEFEIINRIKYLMKERKISQEKLGELLHIHQYDVSRLLNGKPFPSIDQLNAIANFFDVSLYYLIGVHEESYRELSKDTREVAAAYSRANDTIKVVVKRVLDLKND